MYLTFVSTFLQVHFGVNSGATRFAIEHQAVNEATFRCPDEMGWKPQVRIVGYSC
jgi:pyroglutamyl-peptidase